MKLLENINIDGELCGGYIRLFIEYRFKNSNTDTISASFYFSLPDDTAIVGFQLMDAFGKMHRASVENTYSGFHNASSAYLNKLNNNTYCLNLQNIEPENICSILAEAIMPLKVSDGTATISFSLGCDGVDTGNAYSQECPVKIHLFSDNTALNARSADCNVCVKHNCGTDILTETISSEKCEIQIDGIIEKSFGIIGKNTGFFRIYTDDKSIYQKNSSKNILLLLNANGTKDSYIKELAYRITSVLPEKTNLQIVSPDGCLFDNYIAITPDTADKIYNTLCNTNLISSNDISELANFSIEFISDDTDVILITEAVYNPEELQAYLCNSPTPVHILEVNQSGKPTLLDKYGKGIGVYEHFAPEGITEVNTENTLYRIREQKTELHIQLFSGITDITTFSDSSMSVEGYRDIVFKHNGFITENYEIRQDNAKIENGTISDITIDYQNTFTDKLYAYGKIINLRRLKSKVALSSVPAILIQIEDLSTKYGIVTPGVTLKIQSQNNNSIGIPVTTYIGLNNVQKTTHPSIFSEGNHPAENPDKLWTLCEYVLINNIRKNGAVASCVNLNHNDEIQQTAFAAAALELSPTNIDLDFVYQYIKSNPPDGFAAQLYIQRGNLKGFLINYKNEILKELEPTDTLLPKLKGSECVYAAAQLIIHIYLEKRG